MKSAERRRHWHSSQATGTKVLGGYNQNVFESVGRKISSDLVPRSDFYK